MKLHQGHFFDNCRYFHKDGPPYWRQSQVLCVWGWGGGLVWVMTGGLQCQTDASESRSRGSLIFIDMSKLILIRIWIAMDCVKQRHNREVLKERLRSERHFIRGFFARALFHPVSSGVLHYYFSAWIFLTHYWWFQNKLEPHPVLLMMISQDRCVSVIHEKFRVIWNVLWRYSEGLPLLECVTTAICIYAIRVYSTAP